jgi:hypothetical protein
MTLLFCTFMTQLYTNDIPVLDLRDTITGYIAERGFQRISLEDINPLDRDHLIERDARKNPNATFLTSEDATWRSEEGYLVFDNSEGTLAYIRPNPHAPRTPSAVPYEIHFRTTAPKGFNPDQYFSLAVPQRNLTLLLKSLHKNGNTSISAIADLDDSGVLTKVNEQLDEIRGEELPIRLFHSTYVSIVKNEVRTDKEKVSGELSRAIGSIMVAAHLWSRKQIMYYQAAKEADEKYGHSALVE